MKRSTVVPLEERTARLTILIDPRKKALFERLCAQEDLTSSQVVRRMIRAYIETRLEAGPMTSGGPTGRGVTKRRSART
jgi:Ribbon-helix-helix protein